MKRTKDPIQQLASKRLAENLHKIVRIALAGYRKQPQAYRNFATRERHVRNVIEMTYLGFYQEVKAELAQKELTVSSKFFGRFTVKMTRKFVEKT